jgi:hypothetical protein
VKGNELRALDYYGNKIGSVTIKSRLENFHITPDKIYYADPKKHALICVSPSGQYLWTYINDVFDMKYTYYYSFRYFDFELQIN